MADAVKPMARQREQQSVAAPKGPLAGRRILVTRAEEQAAGFCRRLNDLGAEAIEYPTIRLVPPADLAPLSDAIERLASYHWVVFTSANGVSALWNQWAMVGSPRADLFWPSGSVRAAAIGPTTAGTLLDRDVRPAFVPAEFIAERVAEGLGDVAGNRILLPRADIARPALAILLRERGALVDEVTAYCTVPAVPMGPLPDGLDCIAFTSSSTVRCFVALTRETPLPASTKVACIGPITAQTAREMGLRVDVVARQYDVDGLIQAIVEVFHDAR